MHRFLRPHIRVRQQGQTLIIALIVLGVLLILGLVFLGLINRNILNAARGQRRSESSDLAEAGIRYAHGQLVSSPLGADWRGAPAALTETAAGSNRTGDPDAYYLRPASGVAGDLGGPDQLGPFVRIPFSSGRALVRVRYGATDANPTASAGGPLRNPGAVRSMLIIESVGRPGVINPNDPTTFNQNGGVQFRNFANVDEFRDAMAAMAAANGQISTSRRLVAFAPIGIIDAARYETNVFNSSAPIEIGIPTGMGAAAFNDIGGNGYVNVDTSLGLQLGTASDIGVGGRNRLRYGGSFIANGNVLVHGRIDAYMNPTLGDAFRVSGRINGAAGNSTLRILPVNYDPATGNYTAGNAIDLTDGGGLSFDSQDASFSTAGGIVLDGSQRTDAAGYASGVGAYPPPSALTIDPETKLNRYVSMTRETGTIDGASGAQSGAFGHGEGVFVDNASDRQEPEDARGRAIAGSQRSLFDDWLNPNSVAADTGWQGPFYNPTGAVVQLLSDGFTIQRDAKNANERFWRRLDGGNSGLSTIRYRLGRGTDGRVHVLNTLTSPTDINGTLPPTSFDTGPVFNGVLYFEGNARVRGTIPTNVQLTLVSGATIYIDGSILKGTTNNEVTGGTQGGTITGLPRASLMLMAKDNVAVNTTMFVGPTANQILVSKADTSGATTKSPVVLSAEGSSGPGSLDLLAELPLDPTDAAGNPLVNAAQWLPYAMRYRSYDGGGFIPTQLLLSHTMDDGNADASFFALNVNFGAGAGTAYNFQAADAPYTNTAATYYNQTAGVLPMYGLGAEPWQRYSKFETRGFPLMANVGGYNNGQITGTGFPTLFSGTNDFRLRPAAVPGVAANDTLFARAALLPADVKIEASIFAEQGSFFVIPGQWFNPDPNDRHDLWASRVTALQTGGLTAEVARVRANRERLENFGSGPEVPFYGEPLDVRVSIVGSVAENMPPPISVQSEWLRKWGWIPRRIGATGVGIPIQHTPRATFNPNQDNFVPNLTIQYDPILATGRVNDPAQANTILRTDAAGRPLPPMPRLPVSPKLAYFGEL